MQYTNYIKDQTFASKMNISTERKSHNESCNFVRDRDSILDWATKTNYTSFFVRALEL